MIVDIDDIKLLNIISSLASFCFYCELFSSINIYWFYCETQSRKDNYPSEGLATVTFQKSVPMVTYLACFIVCDFQIREGQTARGTPFRVLSRSNQFNSTEYPLKVGIAVTDYYEKYFGIDYVLPKQGTVNLLIISCNFVSSLNFSFQIWQPFLILYLVLWNIGGW